MELLRSMRREAENYLSSFDWCREIIECFYGLGVGGVVAVFLFHMEPSGHTVDPWLWVITGDLSSAYLVVDQSPTPVSALEAYVAEMRKWAEAAKNGTSISDVIPVNVEPNPENAARLIKRLEFLTTEVIPIYK